MTPEETARLKALAQAADNVRDLGGVMPDAIREEFRAAAHPQAVLDLIAEVDRWQQATDASQDLAINATAERNEARARIATLEAENKQLSAGQLSMSKAAHVRIATLEAALRELADAVTTEVNEKGGGGYILARLSDARRALDGGEK